MQTITFKAGDTIISEGDEGNSAFLILEGAVDVTVGQDAKSKKVAELKAGAVFGEMSLIDPGPRSANVVAQTDTTCTVTSYDEFMDLVQENPEQAIVYMQTLVRRLRQMNDMMVNVSPAKRGFLDIFKDWGNSMEFDDTDMTEEEKERRRIQYMTIYSPMF
jgi:CRP/FNR family transcriptional regulator, cyclic AMP receptor protein